MFNIACYFDSEYQQFMKYPDVLYDAELPENKVSNFSQVFKEIK